MSYGHVSGSRRDAKMKKLGQMLLERGWITRGVLDRALAAQSAIGGRLGTCLLDSGAITEEQLLEVLAPQHGVEAADVDTLRGVPEEVHGLIPDRLAERLQAVAVRRLGGRLDVAMADPGDLAGRDEISFAASKRVVALVALEVRIAEALERYYGVHCSARMTRLLDRLNRSRYLWAQSPETIPIPDREGVDQLFPELAELRVPQLPEIDLDLDLDAEPARPAPPAPARRGAGPRRAAAVAAAPTPRAEPLPEPAVTAAAAGGDAIERRLAAADDRDAIGRELVALLRRHFDRVALFAARSDGVHGWMGHGGALDPARLVAFRAPYDEPSVFLNLRRGTSFHLGPLPQMPAHRELARCWHDDAPASCFLLPVTIGGHLAVVLYGDRTGRSLGGLDLAAMHRLGDAASEALERCIVLKKQSQT